ncbi:DEAD/DEAH box helicase [Melghirimyces algeriensis]|uniref:Competence protein ComFA n=1 Tax=Melghirimyces algeriensis TaxID=910412 RepID=A0A521D3N8_9BACL|nr:DEAD/DEAH box helicase [Melghirimyces algeriensis]SMO66316.1 competence protein ComFA [Melghirimyces algeriensis]
MFFYTYHVLGKKFISLSIKADQIFWGMKKLHICPGERYSSVGQAVYPDPPAIPKVDDRIQGEDAESIEKLAVTLMKHLGGRALIWDEVLQWIYMKEKDESMTEEKVAMGLQWLYLTGRASIYPGVVAKGPAVRWKCYRCGSGVHSIITGSCARCEGECAWCDRCVILGKNRSCTPFFLIHPLPGKVLREDMKMNLPGMSVSQQEAATMCLKWLEGQEKRMLIHAVPGSGKTEIMFLVIRHVLNRGERVLWVFPYKEKAISVGERLSQAFPNVSVGTISGELGKGGTDANLITATIQQASRFYTCFHLVIIDEADLESVLENSVWRYGIRRAMHPQGKQIILTVTPSNAWKRNIQRNGEMIRIASRFHGYPLPVPKVYRVWALWRKVAKGRSIPYLESFIKRVKQKQGQALVFVPRTVDTESFLYWIQCRFPDLKEKCDAFIHQDETRDQKMERFLSGWTRLIVMTPHLAKGVTVPRCHVAVVGADHPVFSTGILVRMAGKVGRSASYQKGDVGFFSSVWTEAQKRAVKEIKQSNRIAKQRGTLIGG